MAVSLVFAGVGERTRGRQRSLPEMQEAGIVKNSNDYKIEGSLPMTDDRDAPNRPPLNST